MPSLVEVLAIQKNPRAIIPCIRISRGIYTAASDYKAPFSLEMVFSYTSGGKPQRVLSTQPLGAMSLHARLDEKNLDVHAAEISAAEPDTGAPVTASVRILMKDPSGSRIEVTDPQTTTVRVSTG